MLAPRDATLCAAPQCWPWEKTIVVYYGHLHVQCYIRRAQPVFVFMAEASSSERIHSRIIKTNRHLRWRLEKSRPNLLCSHSGSDTQDWLLPPTLQCSYTSSNSAQGSLLTHRAPGFYRAALASCINIQAVRGKWVFCITQLACPA